MRAWPIGLQALGCFISIQRQAVLSVGWTVEMPSPPVIFSVEVYIWCQLGPGGHRPSSLEALPLEAVVRRAPLTSCHPEQPRFWVAKDLCISSAVPAALLEPPSVVERQPSAAFPVRDVK